ncbi:MAG: signal peptidase I [Blautia sp.]|nr:signal peptidase I [Blautia sp.]
MEKIRNMLLEPLDRLRDKIENNEKIRAAFRLGFEILAAFLLGALVAVCGFQSVTMQESSMEPTLAVGDKFFINRLAYRISEPKRGDIIVYKTNASDDAALHIHRIIGLPGETVQIVGGRVLINGGNLKETGDYPSISNAGLAASPLTLESGEYFVLGDNRNNSEDSRYGDIGVISSKYIVGKLWFRTSPASSMGFM